MTNMVLHCISVKLSLHIKQYHGIKLYIPWYQTAFSFSIFTVLRTIAFVAPNLIST